MHTRFVCAYVCKINTYATLTNIRNIRVCRMHTRIYIRVCNTLVESDFSFCSLKTGGHSQTLNHTLIESMLLFKEDTYANIKKILIAVLEK